MAFLCSLFYVIREFHIFYTKDGPKLDPLFIIERGQNFTVRVTTSVILFFTDQTISVAENE